MYKAKANPSLNYKTIGYIPPDFPKDLNKVSTFHEHMILAQIFDSLISSDKFGNIKPGIAKSWSFAKDGKTIVFKLSKDIKFTNGKQVTAADVKYSILKHVNDKESQSNGYLKDIKEIKIISENEIKFELSSPRVAFLKILSRDHLGIVPENWVFNNKSINPFIGTGAYDLIFNDGNWWLVLKEGYGGNYSIKKWKLLHGSTILEKIEIDKPDYIPFFPASVNFFKVKELFSLNYNIEKQISYIQTSIWRSPFTNLSESEYENAYLILSEYVNKIIRLNDYEPSTGVIPKGILGHLNEIVLSDKKPEKFKNNKIIKLLVTDFVYPTIFNLDVINTINKKYNIELDISKKSTYEISGQSKKNEVDFIGARWAGGFNDPEGFLGILKMLFGMRLEEYLKNDSNIYEKAVAEWDDEERASKFNLFSRLLITKNYLLPCWSTPAYKIFKKI